VDIRHIEYLMPTATSSCMFASGQILFRISPDRVTGELAAALGGAAVFILYLAKGIAKGRNASSRGRAVGRVLGRARRGSGADYGPTSALALG